MPFADSNSFEDCVKKRMKESKYDEETAKKVCGKMKSELEKGSDIEEHEPSPVKKDTKEIGPVVKAWEFNPNEIMNSARKVTGTFHVPKIDKDNEIITKAAMGEAIPDFMHLPILHDFHKERVLGVVTKVWEEADAFHFNALFKATTDVDDAWAKVQKGEYDHVSIFGARLKGNTSCGLNPSQRSVPCVSEKIRLDSISACDTNARNDSTSLVMAKAFYTDEFDIIKALSSDSGLSHGIYDGGKKGDKMKVHEADGDDVEDDEEDEEKDVKKGQDENLSRYGKEKRERREHAEKTYGGKMEPSRFEAYEKAEGSPAVREDIEAKKKDFAERQAGTKRSQGEDFHGGKLEKSDELPTDEEEDFERRAHEKYGKKEVEKCGCGKGSLQKAKDGLKKIYGMLKTLTQHDKEMVEKDKEVHDSMEKSTRTERSGEQNQEAAHRSGMQVFGQPVNKPRSDEPSKKDARPRFSKGAIRPKEGIKNHKEDADVTKGSDKGSVRFVDADEDDKKTYADHRKEEAPKGEVEKGATNANYGTRPRAHRGTFRERHSAEETSFGANQRLREHSQEYKKGDWEKDEKGNFVETPYKLNADGSSAGKGKGKTYNGKGEEVEKGKDMGTRTQRTLKENDEARLKSRFGIKERSEKNEVEKGSWSGTRTEGASVSTKKQGSDRAGDRFGVGFRLSRLNQGRNMRTGTVQKGDTMTEDVTEEIQKANLEEMTDEQFVAEIVKAELKNIQSTDEIVKAAVEAQVGEIRKAMETQIAELKAQLTKIEEQPMVKAAIIVPEDGKVDMPLNYAAVANFMKRG